MGGHVAGAGGDLVRAAEWQQVREFASAARDAPAALALTGEAGSGKSRLWRAAVAATDVSGTRVLRSEPSAADADAPFAGLSDLLGAILPTMAVDLPEPQRQALALILPGGRATGPSPAPHAVGRAVLAALDSLLAAGPLMLAIDDVHCLDRDSLHALAFAARRVGHRSLSLLLTARISAPADPLTVGDCPPTQDWRALLTAFGTAEEIALRPLDATQVRCLLPTTATSAQAQLVARQSRGNPFWAKEIWANLASGAAPSAADDIPVPAIARAALTERLAHHLDWPAAEALAVVAAAGRITASQAAVVLADLAVPVDGIDAAVLAGVIVEASGKLAAAHPLIGTAAVEALPADRKGLIYRRLAAISAGLERRAQFAALAASASGTGAAPDVADMLDAAAAAAHAKAANTAAGKFAAQAVTFTPASDTKALTRRRIRAGELLDRASDLAGARAQFEALDLDSLPTADLERVLPTLVDAVEYLGEQATATAMITRALKTAGDDSRRRALALSLASDFSYGIQGKRRESAIEAIRCAEAAGPAANRSLHRALVNLAGEKTIAGEGLDGELLDRASRLERCLPNVPLYATADFYRGAWSRLTENLEAVRTALLGCIDQAREAGEDLTLALFLSYLAVTEELAGDYAKAAGLLAEVRTLEAAYDWPPSPWLLEPQCKLLIAAGNPGEAVRLADAYLPEDDRQQFTIKFTGACLRGKASWWAGDLPTAVRHLELAARYADESGWQDPGARSRIDPLLAEAYLATGRVAEAARISAWLHEAGTRMNRPTLVGDAHRIDALAAAANGDLAAAAQAAQAAVAAHEQSPLRPVLARSLLVLGRIERQRGDRPASRAALRRSRDLALVIGHQPLLASIKKESPRAALSPAQAGNALTEAERRVADQISRGATSREAAAALFLSVRTVDGHVASICRKLGVRSRSELRRVLT
jgi:DNA-binding CsgD family transcriptional regulator